MTNDDAAALAAYRSDPVQARYQSWETPYPLLQVVVEPGARRTEVQRDSGSQTSQQAKPPSNPSNRSRDFSPSHSPR